MLVAQLAVHIELQGGAGPGRAAEPQQSRVRAPVGQARLLQVHRVHPAVLPLVPHQHCPGAGGRSVRAPPHPSLLEAASRASPLYSAVSLNAGCGAGTQHEHFASV